MLKLMLILCIVKVLNIEVVLPSQNEKYTYIETSEISVQDGKDLY